MKLFTRYSRITLLANIAVFLLATVAFYFSIRYVLVHVIDEDLEIEEDEIHAYVNEHNRLPESFSVSDQVIKFHAAQQPVKRKFSTIVLVENEKNKENYRRLQFAIVADGQTYVADVAKSLEGTNHLLRSILTVSISTVLLILLVAAVVNRVLLKKLWQPFYESLSAVQGFRPSKDKPLLLAPTSIDEFNLMNGTIEGMAKTSRLEYLSLKTFSENASHEIQTPIAIIRSKLDLLIQDEGLTENQSRTLQSAYNAVEKLSRLNSSLLLLAKIENNQFEESEPIDLKEKLEEKLQDFQELWQAKCIIVNVSLQEAVVSMNKELADVLLNNLLSNAINHNYQGGKISIRLSNIDLTLCNTSHEEELEAGKMFQRFYKTSSEKKSNGLGLSILKQIADVSSLKLNYAFQKGEHCFTVSWQQLMRE